MKKVLITGADGMLGEAVAVRFKGKYDLVLTDKEELDVRYWADWEKYGGCKYKYIIHLAAITDLELCESEHELAAKTNITGTEWAASFAKKVGCPLIHISTAGVFDGTEPIYTEDHTPNPINQYGRTKYYSETHALDYDNSYVFRAGWMMGGANRDKKFVSYIIDKLRKGAKELLVVNDTWGSPTYTHDLANQIYMTVEQDADRGLYHAAGGGRCTRYDIACKIVEYLKRDDVKVIPCNSETFERKFTTRRAVSEAMENKRLTEKGINYMRSWETALHDYIEDYYTWK